MHAMHRLHQFTDPNDLHRPAVLLVDDVSANLVATRAALEDGATRILTAASGQQALDILSSQQVAVALLDVHMPGMSGFELASHMRSAEGTRETPIIFLTASAQDVEQAFHGYEVGAVDYLNKPIDRHILRSKVSTFVTLAEARRRLEEADRMRELFMAALGHDLRNPLSSVLMAAELAADCDIDAEARAALGRIHEGATRVSRLVEQLLDTTRFRNDGQVVLVPTEVDLQALVDTIVAEFQRAASRFRIDFLGDSKGFWDPDRLAQVMSNLVGNAVQHSPPEAPIRLRIDGRKGEQVVLQVQNGGPPIPERLRPILFEPFRRFESKTDRHPGLGLGLFITRQLVLAHGGTIEVESSEDAGTTFTLRLPRDPRPPPSPGT